MSLVSLAYVVALGLRLVAPLAFPDAATVSRSRHPFQRYHGRHQRDLGDALAIEPPGPAELGYYPADAQSRVKPARIGSTDLERREEVRLGQYAEEVCGGRDDCRWLMEAVETYLRLATSEEQVDRQLLYRILNAALDSLASEESSPELLSKGGQRESTDDPVATDRRKPEGNDSVDRPRGARRGAAKRQWAAQSGGKYPYKRIIPFGPWAGKRTGGDRSLLPVDEGDKNASLNSAEISFDPWKGKRSGEQGLVPEDEREVREGRSSVQKSHRLFSPWSGRKRSGSGEVDQPVK